MVKLNRMRFLIGYERRLQMRYLQELSDATKMTSTITGMPRGSSQQNQVENGAIKLAEVKDAYREVLFELRSMRAELEEYLPSLNNPDDIGIMRLRYMDGYDLKDIPGAVCLSERAMFYHLARAERTLARMFPGKISLQ